MLVARRQHESLYFFVLRWAARLLSILSIVTLLLFVFGEDGIVPSVLQWEEIGALLMFPFGLIIGLLIGWQDELRGGAIAAFSIAVFYLIYGVAVKGTIDQGLWFLIFAIPGFLFLIYGILSRSLNSKIPGSDPGRND